MASPLNIIILKLVNYLKSPVIYINIRFQFFFSGEINDFYAQYNLKCAIVVPLKIKGQTVGTLKLYKDKENSI